MSLATTIEYSSKTAAVRLPDVLVLLRKSLKTDPEGTKFNFLQVSTTVDAIYYYNEDDQTMFLTKLEILRRMERDYKLTPLIIFVDYENKN